MTLDTTTRDRLTLRREAAEALIRAGRPDGLGPAAWFSQLEPTRFNVLPHTSVIDRALTDLLVNRMVTQLSRDVTASRGSPC